MEQRIDAEFQLAVGIPAPRWPTRFVRAARVRDDTRFRDGRLDRGTLAPLAPEETDVPNASNACPTTACPSL